MHKRNNPFKKLWITNPGKMIDHINRLAETNRKKGHATRQGLAILLHNIGAVKGEDIVAIIRQSHLDRFGSAIDSKTAWNKIRIAVYHGLLMKTPEGNYLSIVTDQILDELGK
jgi:hypothetical protein